MGMDTIQIPNSIYRISLGSSNHTVYSTSRFQYFSFPVLLVYSTSRLQYFSFTVLLVYNISSTSRFQYFSFPVLLVYNISRFQYFSFPVRRCIPRAVPAARLCSCSRYWWDTTYSTRRGWPSLSRTSFCQLANTKCVLTHAV